MNDQKAVRPGPAERQPVRSESPADKPLRSEARMHTDAQVRKAGGRLSREDQRRLGDILQRVYDDVIRQGVPDRFRNLLNELDGGEEKGLGDAARAAGHGQADDPDQDRLVEAKGFPHHKGSR